MANGHRADFQDRPAARVTPSMFHILLALAQRNRHGYGIKKEVDRLHGGGVTLGSGTLYRSLQRLITEGMVVRLDHLSDTDPEDSDQRVLYEATEYGRFVAAEEARRAAQLVEAAIRCKLLPGFRIELPDEEPGPQTVDAEA